MRLVIGALGPVRENCTAMGRPGRKDATPSRSMGRSRFDHDTVTSTGKLPWARLPLRSVAVQVTTVVPSENCEAAAGVHETCGAGSVPSVAVAV